MANNKTYNSEKMNPPPSSKKNRPVYCIVCRSNYLKHAGHDHMHSMLHHRQLEAATDKKELHTCQACNTSSMSLQQYAEHISTAQHKASFKILISKNVKPLSVERLLGEETFNMILKRNKSLKKVEKKAKVKVKKKQKQMAGQKSAGLKTEGKNTEASSVQKKGVSKPMHAAPKEGNNAVFQNIENKVSTLQRPHWHAHSFPQTTNGAYMPPWPVHPTGHHSSSLHQGNQPACHVRYNDNFSVNSPHSSSQAQGAQSNAYHRRPYSFHMGASRMQQPQPWPTVGQYYSEQQHNHAAEEDFSKDYFPQGRSFFNQNQAVGLQSSQPHHSARPTSPKPPVSTAPIRDTDVSVMLKQIRRALGVREPCRADREARKQNSEASNHVSDSSAASKPVRAEIEQSGNASASTAPWPSAQVNSIPSAKPKNNKTEELSKKSSVALNGLLGDKERESQPTTDSEIALSQSTIKTTLFEPTNSKGKVRIAHNSAKAQQLMKTKLQPTLQKLQTSLSGANCKLRSRMNDGVKMQKIKSTHMLSTNMNINCVQHQQRSTQPLDNDLPLSEGFQWESFSNSPSASHLTLQPASQHTADTDCHTQSSSLTQKALEQPETTQQGCSQMETRPSIKVEPNESQDSRENNGVSKRKSNMVADDGTPDTEQRKKKTKLHNDQNQMDQLLAVSLREEEVSLSMVELDKSLIQARNALQAAYAEVQRLMLLRQQFMSEVNTLRAKRIEILQGMQEVYSETSHVTEKATTSSAAAAASSAFHTSSSQPSPATTAAASIAVPHPVPIALSAIKQEARPSPQTVSHTTDSSPSHSATPSTAAASTKQPQAQCSPSPKARVATESSVWQQEKETRDGLQNSVRTLAKEPQLAENVEETRGNPSKASLADKSEAKGVKNISVADNDGNESDASVEMVSYSAQEIIDIDESDKEDSPSAKAVPQTSVTVESTTTSTQTCPQMEAERKCKPPAVPGKDATSPAAPVEDEEPSLGAFLNHTSSVHGLQVHEGRLYTCSGDNTARAYSLATRECLTVFEGHTNKVNCLLVSSFPNMPAQLYTGSSDQTICCFSIKTNKCLEQISLPDRVLCLHIAWNILYAGLANGSVVSYDLKTLKQLDVFECHGPRGVSCLGTTQEGARRLLLVGSYDNTISVRDAKSGLLLRSLEGHTKTVLCMKVVNDLVFSGSSDTSVHAHNIHTGELVRIYKGHGHAVTSIVILGKVMVTACLDKLVRVYELQSHDRLQVYGGHSDMVMCMAVHKSVIYTGCYDGTIQAVKLNLMKNHRCWWQNCSLIFGMADHLVQHLVNDHGNPNLQTMKCRWRGCGTFFSSQQSVQQDAPEHMQLHVQNDSTLQP